VQPIHDFDALELIKAVERPDPRLEHFDPAEWPLSRPCRGVTVAVRPELNS